jgi:hypothetical protein
MKIRPINSWHTVIGEYKSLKMQEAEIVTFDYDRGIYTNEGLDGYDYYEVMQPIKVNALQISGKTWMVDDPLHWYGMRYYVRQLLAERPEGDLLCVGLGLGLMVHHALELSNPNLHVFVIEKNVEVATMMTMNLKQTLPTRLVGRFTVVIGGFYATNQHEFPTCTKVLWDLAVGGVTETAPDVAIGMKYLKENYPDCTKAMFGVKFGKQPRVILND